MLGAHEPFLGGQQGRELVAGGEIRHVRHRIPGPAHRTFCRIDERPARREVPQLTGMTQENPPRNPHNQ